MLLDEGETSDTEDSEIKTSGYWFENMSCK